MLQPMKVQHITQFRMLVANSSIYTRTHISICRPENLRVIAVKEKRKQSNSRGEIVTIISQKKSKYLLIISPSNVTYCIPFFIESILNRLDYF